MFLLDTNVLSELRRRERVDPKVAAWADDVQPSDLFLSAITILEIEAGTLMLERRDKAQAAVLRMWIDSKPGHGTRIEIEIPELQSSLASAS